MQSVPAGRGVAMQIPLFARSESPRDVDVHAISRPARKFTGDFYFVHRNDDTLWLAIGDVAGKGLKAAVIMAMIQEQLEEEIVCATDVASTMERIHLALRAILPRNLFATVAIVQIRDDGRLIVANAGHPPLFVARGDGRIDSIGSTGPVVGLLPNAAWHAVELPFRRGDTLVAYTDGVIEARDEAGEEFGDGRVREALKSAVGLTRSVDVAERINAALASHAARPEDDVTVIVARR